MTYRVIVLPTADAEAMEAFRWYDERSVDAAERWYQGLDHALATLAEKPERYPISREDTDALGCEVRILLYGRRRGIFRILYHIDMDRILVLRIRHSAQGPIG